MKALMARLAGLLAVCLLAASCTTIQSFPIAARPGDTISLAVGSQDGMNEGNTTVTFISDSDLTPIDITAKVRAIFNLYSDKATNTYSPNIQSIRDNFSYLHHEPWQSVIVLNLPTTLPVGPGNIRVQTTAPQPAAPLEPSLNGLYPNLNDVDISLEILPGTGSSNLFNYKTIFNGTLVGNLGELEPGRQALIRPPKADPGDQWPGTFSAIEIKLNVPMTDQSGSGVVNDDSIRLVPQDVSMFTGSKAQLTWQYDGTDITVLYISSSDKLKYYEPRFAIVAELADFDAPPTITSIRYFDSLGNEVTGPIISDYSVGLLGSFL